MENVKLNIAVHVFLNKDNKLLLLKRKNTKVFDNMWSVPSGRLNSGEGILKAIIREIKEEVGVDIKVEDLSEPLFMHHKDERGERVYVFFICHNWQGEPENLEKDKCEKIEWFNIEHFPKDLLPHIKEAWLQMQNKKIYIEYGF
ncbi:MAG: NUDIX domain-containing protein [Patescibacteria group bacterium]|jgi:mutator protein MutT